jgi:hypothetical protein
VTESDEGQPGIITEPDADGAISQHDTGTPVALPLSPAPDVAPIVMTADELRTALPKLAQFLHW